MASFELQSSCSNLEFWNDYLKHERSLFIAWWQSSDLGVLKMYLYEDVNLFVCSALHSIQKQSVIHKCMNATI